MSDKYDLIVIGGGSAGLVAAGGAGILGAKVALIEKNLLGGDCLYTGCVPSKTLIRSAKLASDIKNAEKLGFQIPNSKFQNDSFASITNRVRSVIETIEEHDSPERFERMGVEVIFGSAKFLNPNEIEVSLKNSNEKRLMRAKRFCIATGSSPFIPPIEGLNETGFITNEEVFELKDLPERLIVLGGGAIGAELGQAFGRFGSRVTLIEMSDRILSKEDDEISALIERIFAEEGIEVLTETKAVKFHKNQDGEKIVTIEKDAKTEEIACDEILAAVGRKPNTKGLDLEKAGVKYDEKQIFTDEYLHTSQKHIYAAGDVTGHFQFTHTADYEAQIVLQNAFLFYPFTKKADFSVVPWAIFTEPEVARVGLTEKEGREKYGEVKVIKVFFDENDRAQTEGESNGFAKIILRRKKIVGAHIVGLRAGELIHEFVLAMKHNLSLAKLNEAIHVYPTLSKITQAAATEQTLESLKSPFAQKWFARYLKIWR
ncbi:MAG TPA: FAD-dependent oxidoreductase [Pyrinomonadaceae bacterium]|nr:FAD-dependent oxidoreductase [Pyrinomonadaceae bacterium]